MAACRLLPRRGAGDGVVPYTVDVNEALTARVGRITVAGFTFIVTQVAPPRRAGRLQRRRPCRSHRLPHASGSVAHRRTPRCAVGPPRRHCGAGRLQRRRPQRQGRLSAPPAGSWFVDVPGMPPIQWGLVGDLPVPADYDGDDATDAAIYRTTSGSGVWYVRGQFTLTLGARGDLPVPADYDGDGKADPAVYRPATGGWSIATSTSGFATVLTPQWGVPGDVPVPGDFDGDGARRYRGLSAFVSHVVRRPVLRRGVVRHGRRDGRHPGGARLTGDGADEFVVFRPSDGTWLEPQQSDGHRDVAGVRHDRRSAGRAAPRLASVAQRRLRRRRPRRSSPCSAIPTACGTRGSRAPASPRPLRCSGASPATRWCRATTTAIAAPTSRCGARAAATWYVRLSSTGFTTSTADAVGPDRRRAGAGRLRW